MSRIHEALVSDHVRGCQGRSYTCSCGHDERVRQALIHAERAEAEALGWERKNAQNVGKYEREADALRALLAEARDYAASLGFSSSREFCDRIDAALREGKI